MRRKKCEITDRKAIECILDSATIGRIATLGSDGYPYITPVNFVFHRGNIYFHSAPEGEKLDNISRNPNVCFEVDIPLAYLDSGFDPDRRICQLHQLYHSVIVRGKASLVLDDSLKVQYLNALVSKHEHHSDHDQVTVEMKAFRACVVVEIKPTSISAKSDLWQYKASEVRIRLAQYLKNRKQPSDLETIVSMGFNPEDLWNNYSKPGPPLEEFERIQK